ncbi:hypothetical protein ACEWY4_022362 [Coilia grayii]|uniref:Uncharacterized protein n=1 Tax=Coilia grayii TaxID=363190 RepID=A0ABD1J642_9TELE
MIRVLLSDIDPLWGSCLTVVMVGLAISAYWLWNSKLDLCRMGTETQSQTALDSLHMWARKHCIEYQNDMLQVDSRRKHSDKGHQVFNVDMLMILKDALKELLRRLKVKYTSEDLKKLTENLQIFLTRPEQEIIEELMVVDISHKIPDFSREVFGIFRDFLIKAIADYMEDSVKNIHNSSRKSLSRRVKEITEMMNQYEVYVDAMARNEWVLNGNRNRQVYRTPEDRERVYEKMREVLKGKLKNILGHLKKIIGKIKLAYQNDLDVYYYWYCLVVALGYLSFCQITRVYVFDYGMYSADFTGPMMVITQKITSLAFEIHDGMARKEEQLTPNQKMLAIRRMPSLLEYFSYNCNFMGILAGPTCSYNDYIAFIEGSPSPRRHLRTEVEAGRRANHQRGRQADPSPNMVVARKLATSFLSLLVFLSVCKVFPVERNIDDHFIANTPFYAQVVFLYLSMLTTRPKYYFVWTLADAINNAAGFGFNGYDSDGSARWDLISNLRITNIELATSFKMFLDNWNIQTAHWLKRVCYERCPYNPTAATFLLSAMWHGAYPGYYLTFLTGIVVTLAARAVRHNIRPHFLGSPSHKLVYDIITWAGTQIAICYTVVPFVLLSVEPSLKFYRSWCFSVHIACVLIALALPVKPRHLRLKEQQRQTQAQQLGVSSHQDNHHHHYCHHLQQQHHPQATDSNCIQKEKTS